MRVLIACEFSGIVRESFAKRGHDAWSIDLLPTEKPGNHIQGDISTGILERRSSIHWDLMIAHPPCTYLAVSGAGWFYHPEDKHLPFKKRRPHPKFPNRQKDKKEAELFFMALINANINKICVENPIGTMSTFYRKPNQIVQPWQFGHGETKATCFWLKNLPKLTPTKIVEGREQRNHYMSPSPDRPKNRSRTYQGIADAMADHWG